MTTLRQHVDEVIASEDWCKIGAAIVQGRDSDTATWYGQIDQFRGFVNIWWIANPDAARGFVLAVVADLVVNMPECEAKKRLADIVDGTADLAECAAWGETHNAETDCCNLVVRLAKRLMDGSTARQGYGMLGSLQRSYQVVNGVGKPEADVILLAAARKAAPLDVWRGRFE